MKKKLRPITRASGESDVASWIVIGKSKINMNRLLNFGVSLTAKYDKESQVRRLNRLII